MLWKNIKHTFKEVSKILAKILAFALIFSVPFPTRAYVLYSFWGWFVVPFGLPKLSYWYHFVIILTSSLILVNVYKNRGESINNPNDRGGTLENLFIVNLETFTRTLVIFVIGLIIHLFII